MATEADIDQELLDFVHAPYMEVVRLDVSDNETYKSKKFQTILGAVATSNEATDGYIQVTFSGPIATFHTTAGADKITTLVLFGVK